MPRTRLIVFALLFAAFYTVIAFWPGGAWLLVREYGVFFGLGLLGALVANSTGAGGGVVFIPFFTALGLSPTESVGTSMAIQCCGMTAGSIAWLSQLQKSPASFHCDLTLVKALLPAAGLATIAGVLCAQYLLPPSPFEVKELFRWFSIVFAVILFGYTWATRHSVPAMKTAMGRGAYGLVVFTGFTGGIVTAWLSVAVGECLALLLFFLGFSAKLAVALGVVCSSLAVLAGVIHHLWVTDAVVWEVFLFAGQAALIGGTVARYITQWLGGFRLKLVFAVWIFLSGVFIG